MRDVWYDRGTASAPKYFHTSTTGLPTIKDRRGVSFLFGSMTIFLSSPWVWLSQKVDFNFLRITGWVGDGVPKAKIIEVNSGRRYRSTCKFPEATQNPSEMRGDRAELADLAV